MKTIDNHFDEKYDLALMEKALKEGRVRCLYDMETVAVKRCCKCTAGLCSSCGYLVKDSAYCNECYEKYVVKSDAR